MDHSPSPLSALLARVQAAIRVKHYSLRTEQAYCDWIKRYASFHGKRHPEQMGAMEIEQFLSHLAVDGKVASSTQNQAKAALLFLYREALGVELPWLDNIARARVPTRLPTVLTREETARVLARLHGVHSLVGGLLYGAGLRIMEALRLRVQDVDIPKRQLIVRSGKGFKDRMTLIPERVAPSMNRQIHEKDTVAMDRLAHTFRRSRLDRA